MTGPDAPRSAEYPTTWVASEAVKLQLGAEGLEATPPISVITMLKRTVEKAPLSIAMGRLSIAICRLSIANLHG